MIRPIISDLETYLEVFLCQCYSPEEKKWYRFEVSKWKNEIDAFVNFFEEHEDYHFVFYNGLRFDTQVAEFIIRTYHQWIELTSLEICAIISQFATDVINDSNYDIFPKYREADLSFKTCDPYELAGYSNKMRRVGLKRLEFEMDLIDIDEMPIHFLKKDLSREELNRVALYCKNDTWALYQFYLIIIGQTEHALYKGNNQIELRESIEQEFGIKCLNYSDSKIGDEIIKKYYCEEKRIQYSALPKKGFFRKSVEIKNCIAKYVEFKTPQLKKFLKDVRLESLGIKDDFKKKIEFYGNVYSFMKGGLHTEQKPKIYEADEEYLIIDWDVSSYYPAIIINNGRYPFHLGKEFLKGYQKVFEKRLELKPLSKNDKKIKGVVDALKLSVNSVYGKSSDMQSWIYDRQLTMFTTITGELSLMMLIEAYELEGIHVISANTDGVTLKIKKDKVDKMHYINAWWMGITKYELERTDYSKIIFSTVNDYIAVKTNGELKFKGDFLVDFELHKNKSARVVPLALKAYFVDNIPIEEFITSHKNIYDFAIRQKASKDFHYEGVNKSKIVITKADLKKAGWTETYNNLWKKVGVEDNNSVSFEFAANIVKQQKQLEGNKTVYNKLIRYYVSNTGEKLYKIKNPECTTNAPKVSQVNAGDWLMTTCNYLPKNHPLTNIDYSFYITKAQEIVHKVEHAGKRLKKEDKNQLKLF